MQIPRIIHQILLDKTKIPDLILKNIADLESMNPGWQYHLYDDREIMGFIQKNYGQDILQAYNSINPSYGAARADLFRYLLIYKIGGVYLDIKSGCSKPFESIIKPDDALLLSFWRNQDGEEFKGWGKHYQDGVDNEFQSWHIICAPQHPIIAEVIKFVLMNISQYTVESFGVSRKGVLRTTGPIAYTKAIRPLLSKFPYRIFDSQGSGLIYSVVANPEKPWQHLELFGKHYTENTDPIIYHQRQNVFHNMQKPDAQITGKANLAVFKH